MDKDVQSFNLSHRARDGLCCVHQPGMATNPAMPGFCFSMAVLVVLIALKGYTFKTSGTQCMV